MVFMPDEAFDTLFLKQMLKLMRRLSVDSNVPFVIYLNLLFRCSLLQCDEHLAQDLYIIIFP